MRARLSADFARFARELPREFPAHVRQVYGIDLTARFLGRTLPHPIGKGSGQLSLNPEQLETDRAAGLAFVVLKTVIGEDFGGGRSMEAWAIHETRMQLEQRRGTSGRMGWTVTWKGRGWDRSLEAYAALVQAARHAGDRPDGIVAVPSVKLHLPLLDEAFREDEYAHTLTALARAWGDGPLPVEKDFSPTLAGDALADERSRVLRWIANVPDLIRRVTPGGAMVQLKLMTARFDDAFQLAMLEAATHADGLTVFNRLFDADRRVAYGGWDLSDRNLRVLGFARASQLQLPPLSGSGNVCSGRMIVAYARLGCESVQLHTFFQLPLGEYPATHGTRTQRALHRLIFDPMDGLVAALLDLEEAGELARRNGELRFLDLVPVAAAAR
ncbi:MAG TPA: hypothetical protein VFM14_02375 [Gemmatimonadales bacterium]|nr:hypothetical protein [Gemmatimonadales bacterium]